MGLYRALNDLVPGLAVIPAGTVFTDGASPGVQLAPTGWIPGTPAVEPLDADAVAKFFAAGPYPPSLIRGQFTNAPVQPPTTFWQRVSGNTYQLTGLGIGLGQKQMFVGCANGGIMP
jgi:hypothetical protein